MKSLEGDVVVIGAGIAGLVTALSFPKSFRVFVICERHPLISGSTPYAKGGIAIALGEKDKQRHIIDTINAGGRLCNKNVVENIINKGENVLKWFENLNLLFDKDIDGKYEKGLEGAHSFARVLHINGDKTGKGISKHLNMEMEKRDNITCFNGEVKSVFKDSEGGASGVSIGEFDIFSKAVVIASGGSSGIFSSRTAPANPLSLFDISLKFGCFAKDMEFFQYHPTVMDLPIEKNSESERLPIITEAVRGDGAILQVKEGKNINIGHQLENLAPRDIVARAVFRTRSKGKRVYLNTKGLKDFEKKFPSVTDQCKIYDVNRNFIPVRTAVHYQCGGIDAEINGKTNVNRLYAIGEFSCTGLHGSNRLASNSLLEAAVMGISCANEITKNIGDMKNTKSRIIAKKDEYIDMVRAINDKALGIVRSKTELLEALVNLEKLNLSPNIIVSKMAIVMAILRTESEGCHYRIDFPNEGKKENIKFDLNDLNKKIKEILK